MNDHDTATGATDGERIAVIGSGYVGLTLAACLAHLGHLQHETEIGLAVGAVRSRKAEKNEIGLLDGTAVVSVERQSASS